MPASDARPSRRWRSGLLCAALAVSRASGAAAKFCGQLKADLPPAGLNATRHLAFDIENVSGNDLSLNKLQIAFTGRFPFSVYYRVRLAHPQRHAVQPNTRIWPLLYRARPCAMHKRCRLIRVLSHPANQKNARTPNRSRTPPRASRRRGSPQGSPRSRTTARAGCPPLTRSTSPGPVRLRLSSFCVVRFNDVSLFGGFPPGDTYRRS